VRALFLLMAFAAMVATMAIFPYAGLLSWAWFSFMQPHRETFGFAHTFAFDYYIALLTMLAWIMSSERKTIPLGITPILLFVFGLWICVTTYNAIDQNQSYDLWERTEKSLILVLFVIIMTNTKARMHALVWIIAISLGYYAVKGAGYVFFAGGGKVYGPENTMINDNNALGVALVTILPLLIYLIRSSSQQFVKTGCYIVAASIIVTVVGTFSRGGFLALAAMGALLALRSRAKVAAIVGGLLAAAIIFQTAPPAWRDRMATILAADPDASVLGRYQAWTVAWNVATQRPTGGGFAFGERQPVWDMYTAVPGSTFHAAHNIYFEVLGEHGFIGLTIYLLIVLSALRNTQVASRLARDRSEAVSVGELANALQLSILCVAVGGVSLSIAYYDMYLTLYGMTFALRRMMEAIPSSAATGGRSRGRQIGREIEVDELAG